MTILRKDPVSSGWVIIAEERSQRPSSFKIEKSKKKGGFCPFCTGNESSTPPEIAAYRENATQPNTPGWSVRTIPNKFAALRIEGDLGRRGEGMYDMMNGIGAHEVVIETPEHDSIMANYNVQKMEELVRMYRDRTKDLLNDKRLKYIQIFRNYGPSAGASLEHPHTQIIALPITPRWVKEELLCAKEHWERKERCLFCDILRQEIQDQKRLVFENDTFLSFEPFAAKFPFETWIIPKRHSAFFHLLDEQEITGLAEILKQTLYAIYRALSDPPYNYIIHPAPRLEEDRKGARTIEKDYHWHIEIIPRITKVAGFEWGTGFYINPVAPEKAAEYLREVLRGS